MMSSATMPPWLQDFRKREQQAFYQRGLPSKREERWKYTDVSLLQSVIAQSPLTFSTAEHDFSEYQKKFTDYHLVIMQHGKLVFCQQDSLTQGVILTSILDAITHHADLVRPYLLQKYDIKRYPFVALNNANFQDGIFLYVPKHVVLQKPIYLLHLSTQTTYSRHIIVADQASQLTLVEDYAESAATTDYLTQSITHLYTEKNAAINYYKIQQENHYATHIANIFVQQKQDSQVQTCSIATGSHLMREEIIFALNERGAEAKAYGFYYTSRDNQHIDQQVHMEHLAHHATSHMLYKGILAKKSRAVFNGKVRVQHNIKQSKSHQANHHMLLSNDAEVNAKPELEIYNDDLTCTHAATVGQLDREALFYLRARGISEDAAIQMLTRAFAAEIMQLVTLPSVLQHFCHVLGGVL